MSLTLDYLWFFPVRTRKQTPPFRTLEICRLRNRNYQWNGSACSTYKYNCSLIICISCPVFFIALNSPPEDPIYKKNKTKTAGLTCSFLMRQWKTDEYSTYTTVKKQHQQHADRRITFECLVQLVLAEHDSKVVDGAGVELHPEHHVSGGVPVPLVVTFQLRRAGRGRRLHQVGSTKMNEDWTGLSLTRMSPFRSRPGSMVMQILVLLSPCTLLHNNKDNVFK